MKKGAPEASLKGSHKLPGVEVIKNIPDRGDKWYKHMEVGDGASSVQCCQNYWMIKDKKERTM